MRFRTPLLVMLLLGTFGGTASSKVSPKKERKAVIFYAGDVHGTLEPCGCTSDPLGDITRVTALIRQTQKREKNVLFLDGGNLSFPRVAPSPRHRQSATLRANFLGHVYEQLPLVGCALGELDSLDGATIPAPRRIATNVAADSRVDATRLASAGGIQFGILGYVDPEVAKRMGLSSVDPVKAIGEKAAQLRRAGAEVLVLVASVDRATAKRLAHRLDLDFIVLGKDLGAGMVRADRVGSCSILAAGEESMRLGRLDLVLRGEGKRQTGEPILDAGGPEYNRARAAEVSLRISQLEKDLQKWRTDPEADPAFVRTKAEEVAELRQERVRLEQETWTPPSQGSYFTSTLIPIRRSLPKDSLLDRDLRKLDRDTATLSLKQAEPPPPAEPGQPSFVGDAKCVSCHKASARFFTKTRHAQAWRTLVKVQKQGQEDCVSCHVTGFGEMGGTSLGFTKGLENVQCEACHGAGSTHVAKRGKETPYAGVLKTPEATCVRCHNEKHSDTFEYKAYLRDILGPEHGEDARDALGEGPTGKELRRAAIARAKKK